MELPNLHIFNPSCETAIANGTVSYLPNRTLQTFEDDLSYLPSLFSNSKDLILMPKYESLEHLEELHRFSFPIPGQILQTDFFDEKQRIISEINSYKLWGWSPNWIHRLKKNKRVSSLNFEKSTFYSWTDSHKEIYSRKMAKLVMESITNENNPIYVNSEFRVQALETINELEDFLAKHQQIVLKEPWSSSGRGIIMLRKNFLNTSIVQRVKGVFQQQKYIMAEPMLDKQMDMAMHFEIKNKEVFYKGDTYFKTGSNGQYQANYLNQYPELEDRVLDFLKFNKEQVKDDLLKALSKSEIPKYYEGFLGVDIMIVEQNKRLVFQPCVEINLRNNMGTVALHLQEIIHPEAKGTFNIVFNPKKLFEDIYSQVSKTAIMEDQRIVKGTLSIVSPQAKQFGAYIDLSL